MLSLANARSRGGAARLGRADARAPRARGHRGPELRVRRRAEDRRPRDLAALRGRRARARRDARQRRDRRGRHAQPAHDPDDPAADRCDAPAGARGARRDLHVAEGLRRPQRAPRRGRPVDVHEPAQRRRRARSASSTRGWRASGRCRCGPTGSGAPTGSRSTATGRRWSGCASTASASTATSCCCRPRTRSSSSAWPGRSAAAALDFEIDGVVVKVVRPRAAAPAGRRRARPALGDRLEVPADDEGHDAARHHVERRQVRRPAPVRACSSPSTSAA